MLYQFEADGQIIFLSNEFFRIAPKCKQILKPHLCNISYICQAILRLFSRYIKTKQVEVY